MEGAISLPFRGFLGIRIRVCGWDKDEEQMSMEDENRDNSERTSTFLRWSDRVGRSCMIKVFGD